MWTESLKQLKTAFLLLIFFTIITGIIYPALVTAVAQLLFPWQANGSLITQNKTIIGSQLIGQSFTDSKYFWGRPSATSPYPYNASSSAGSNLGPSNPTLIAEIKQRIEVLHKADPENKQLIPVDLVTTSGSGLDPDISPLAAYYQIHRVAKARGLSDEVIKKLIDNHIIGRVLGILGEPRVNVLQLNLALDQISIQNKSSLGATK